MASVTSQLIEKVTAHAQSDSLEDAETVLTIPNNLHIYATKAYKVCGSRVQFILNFGASRR